MGIVDYILENIEKKIEDQPFKHYALQGENRTKYLLEAYRKAIIKYLNSNHIFRYILGNEINEKKEFLSSFMEHEDQAGWRTLTQRLEKDPKQYFLFIESFDELIMRIDSNYALSDKLVRINNLYMTVTASSNPETNACLIKTNSPYSPYSHWYFRIVLI